VVELISLKKTVGIKRTCSHPFLFRTPRKLDLKMHGCGNLAA